MATRSSMWSSSDDVILLHSRSSTSDVVSPTRRVRVTRHGTPVSACLAGQHTVTALDSTLAGMLFMQKLASE